MEKREGGEEGGDLGERKPGVTCKHSHIYVAIMCLT